MAHMKTSDGVQLMTGALSKKKVQGLHRITVTRVKPVKDPLTGEVVGYGPNEIYLQNRRNYKKNPLTEGEKKQRRAWSISCKEALAIIRDKSHPRYMEMYNLWRAQLSSPNPCKQFPNFVRAELARQAHSHD